MWTNPNSPNLPDFGLFIQQVMQIPAAYLPINVAPPATPTLTASTSGGSLPSETVYVVVTYVTTGETTPSAVASVAVAGPTGQVSVAAPVFVSSATGWNVYAANSSGALVLQNPEPVAIGTNYTITALATGTAAPPTANTAGSPFPGLAFAQAGNLVINLPCIAGNDYTLAYYNCAGHILITITPDQPGRSNEVGSFTQLRQLYELLKVSYGVVQATSNDVTATTLAAPDSLKNLTLSDLDFIKTPYGRRYLDFNQDFGDIFGLT